jgi:hypothetical protein
VHIEVRKQAWNPLGNHRLSYAWWTVEKHVVSTRGGDFAGPLGLDLTHDICQVETTVRMPAGSPTTSMGSTSGIGTPRSKATNWVIEPTPKTSIPSTSSASPAWRNGTIVAIASAGADNDYGHPGAAHAAACAIAGDDRAQDR